MLKDIIKLCRKYEIHYSNGRFIYNESQITYADFIKYVMSKKFTNGLEQSVILAKKNLLAKN